MLKYKITTENKHLIKTDKRKHYIDYNILNILNYSYAQYSFRINTIIQAKQSKAKQLKKLTNTLIQKKARYKQEIKNLNINQKTLYYYQIATKENTTTAKENNIKNMMIILNRLSNKDKISISERLQKYFILNSLISNINSDITKINTIRKDFNKLVLHYQNINLSYDNKAKITLFDISQAKKGILTSNSKEILYFYLNTIKKSNSTTATEQDFIHYSELSKVIFNKEKIKEIIENSINKSFQEHLNTTSNSNSETLFNNILNKWI